MEQTKKFQQNRLLVINDPNSPRICPQLAVEIGLAESILFLQVEFWIATLQGKIIDGRKWVYKSLSEIKEVFAFWGTATISRTISSLEQQDLISVRNDLNDRKGDKTQWFSLNPDGINSLKSVHLKVEGMEQPIPKWNSDFQNGMGTFQNGIAIPETSSETSSEREELLRSSSLTSGLQKNSVVKKKTAEVTEEAVRLAEKLRDSIQLNYPDMIPPTESHLRQWARDLDFLHRIDGKPWDAIEDLLAWSQQDPFWKANILSAGKFREKWNTLLARSQSPGGGFASPPAPPDKMDVLKRMWLKAKEKEDAGNGKRDSRDPDAVECEFSRVAEEPFDRKDRTDFQRLRSNVERFTY